jgi:polysaccharide export outer membrane protein
MAGSLGATAMIQPPFYRPLAAAGMVMLLGGVGIAQGTTPKPQVANPPPAAAAASEATPDYIIGPDDVLTIIVWREKDMSGDVGVRPDGKISLPLINDVQAAGLTPEQLRVQLTELVGKVVEEPTVTVMVKDINSRKVFITGQVTKPGPYPLRGPTTVLQLIAVAGGLTEFADTENIAVLRNVNGKPQSFRFNYKDVSKRRNLEQNLELRPGDTVVVP